MFMGLRHTSDFDDPERYFTDLQKTWALTLPGFANPERIAYLNQFISPPSCAGDQQGDAPRPVMN